MKKKIMTLGFALLVSMCVSLVAVAADSKSGGTWIQDSVGWWYRYSDGLYPCDGWAYIDGDWYYFDETGYRVTGWVKDGGVWYYMLEGGNREETSDLINPDLGKMLHDVWLGDKDGKLYYLLSDGAMATDWQYIRGKWYYFYENGSCPAINYAEVSTLEEWFAIAELSSDTICRLQSDIDVGETILSIPSEKKIVIDLSGHSIKGEGSIISNDGNLTIINSANTKSKISVQCNETVENQVSIAAITNTDDAVLSLNNVCIEVFTELYRELNKESSADFYIWGVLNNGTVDMCDCELALKGSGKVKWNNANLLMYGIQNSKSLTVKNSKISLDGISSSEDTYSGYYCSCRLFGLYNQSAENVMIYNSEIYIKHHVTASECSRDKSSAVYHEGDGELNLKYVAMTCELVDCLQSVFSYIDGVTNAGTGKINISGGKIQVYTVEGNDEWAELYGIQNKRGTLNIGMDDIVTEIHVCSESGNAWGIYDSSREDAWINIKSAIIVAICNGNKNARGIETSSRSVAEVKLGDSDNITSVYPSIYATNSAVGIGSGKQKCYIYSGMYGCDFQKPITGIGVTYPEGTKTMPFIKDGITYLSVVPKWYVKWLKDSYGWWYQRVDGSYPRACWQYIDDVWYYFDEVGYMVTSWLYEGGRWYYLSESGAMVTGWQAIGGVWYYFQGSGAMVANQWVGNYYLQADGSMATNKWIGNYYVGSDGCWIP